MEDDNKIDKVVGEVVKSKYARLLFVAILSVIISLAVFFIVGITVKSITSEAIGIVAGITVGIFALFYIFKALKNKIG